MGIASALGLGLPVILLTITEGSVPRSVGESSVGLTELIKRLQARYGGGLRWVAVLELQARGAAHWHVLIAGLAYCRLARRKDGRSFPGHPRGTFAYEVRKEDDLRPLIERYGFGPVFNVHAVGVGDLVGAIDHAPSYLAKYLGKQITKVQLPARVQPFRQSRGRNAWANGLTLTSAWREAADRAKNRGRSK